MGEVSATAIVTDDTFAVADGELALAAGSSGWTAGDGCRRRFFELFLRGGSAAQRFADPVPGTAIEFAGALTAVAGGLLTGPEGVGISPATSS